MNYIAIVIIEPTNALTDDQKSGGIFFVATGGIPGSDACCGPWSEKQLSAIKKGVNQYFRIIQPEDNVASELQYHSLFSKPNCFISCFIAYMIVCLRNVKMLELL